MSKKETSHNPLMNMTDEEFEVYLFARSVQVPKWIRCTKKEYDTYCPEGPDLMKALLRASNFQYFKKVSNETNTKFKYYKIGGYERALMCGGQESAWIQERQKHMKK